MVLTGAAARNCAFVNFTNISNAIKSIESIKNKPEYASLRIAHGKDRCANPPRSGPQGSSGVRRSASGNTNAPMSAAPAEDGEMQMPFSAVAGDVEEPEETFLEPGEGMVLEGGAGAVVV